MIVDDEPPARDRLRLLLQESEFQVHILGEAGSGEEALSLINDLEPDVLFLDVQMPGLDGFDVVDLLPDPAPHIVFVTAYDSYALKAFEVHAVDYLTKPVRLRRLNDTLARIRPEDGPSAHPNPIGRLRGTSPLKRLTVKVGRRLRVLPVEEVICFEADQKVVFANLGSERHIVDFTLDELERRLDPERFLRIHRSYLVNAETVIELTKWFDGGYLVKTKDGAELPVARRRVARIKELLAGR